MGNKISKEELERNLAQFTGSEEYHKFSHFTRLLATDGVIYLAQSAECFWLLDILASVQNMPKIRRASMQVLIFNKSEGEVRIEDGNKNVLYKQKIDYTDFPLDEITIWVEGNIVLLPSEH
jgi:hypothetical protein